jgi:sensor domain CHASE-containing protein
MSETIYNSSHNEKNLNKVTYMYCHSVQLCVSSITLVIIITICCISVIELHNITRVIHSFNSNIKEDITNVNDFLSIIPDLDKAVHMILQLCTLPEVEPFCNQTSYIHN